MEKQTQPLNGSGVHAEDIGFAGDILTHRPSRLFIILGGFFIANALVAEFVGVKIFALEPTLGVK
ncbi:MAG: hypothetical protein ACKOAY_04530, partial [Haliscomenobacter sp.]